MSAPSYTMEKLTRFLRCKEGSAAVEFALALPVIGLLLVGMMEVAMLLFGQVLAEGGLREAARYGLTGTDPASGTRQEQIVQVVMDHSHGLLDITATDVSLKVYPSFEDIGEPEPLTFDANSNGEWDPGDTYDDVNLNATWDDDMGDPGPGGAGDVVLYQINYQWSFITPIFQVFGGPTGALDMHASIAIRNEPYDLSGGS